MRGCEACTWAGPTMLEVDEISTFYGLSQALFGVSLRAVAGEVVSLVGRNGVGKTTTLRSIAGLNPPRQGRVLWEDRDLAGLPAFRIARLGIAWVPEDRRVFPNLTVRENLDATRSQGGTGWNAERVYELFPDLGAIADRPGGVLSGGEQQMLAIGRSLMLNPRLLLLDEPSEGLAPRVVQSLADQIRRLKESGMSLVLAEQNLDLALSLSDRIHVLEKGQIRFSGSAQELRQNDAVWAKYLAL